MSKAILWGVSLSPYFLKLEACLKYHQIEFLRLPENGTTLENASFMFQLEQGKRKQSIKAHPKFDEEFDEYPAVPYLRFPNGDIYCDSSGIANLLDNNNEKGIAPLFPKAPLENFIATLIEEAFDEFGLYLVHHMRWVGSAKTNIMGKILGREFSSALPLGTYKVIEKSFPKRQVKRCPYLFSVAPPNYRAGVSAALTPPSRRGFPETHSLLYTAWKRYLDAMEAILSKQPFLLGRRFTIADASAYGQLSMNLVDREAADLMLQRAPKTFNWLVQIQHGEHLKTRPAANDQLLKDQGGPLPADLAELLNCIMGTFCALMVQNEKAYIEVKRQGETLFNEAAFNQSKALYEGKLLGFPFKSVVKTFQVKVWRNIKQLWNTLTPEDQTLIRESLEAVDLFES